MTANIVHHARDWQDLSPYAGMTTFLHQEHKQEDEEVSTWMHVSADLGSYRETYSGGVRECGPATAVLHPPGETHSDQFPGAGGRIFRFELVKDEALRAEPTVGEVRLRERAKRNSGDCRTRCWVKSTEATEYERCPAFARPWGQNLNDLGPLLPDEDEMSSASKCL